MSTAMTLLLFALGVVLIVKGGDLFVGAASWMARASGDSPVCYRRHHRFPCDDPAGDQLSPVWPPARVRQKWLSATP